MDKKSLLFIGKPIKKNTNRPVSIVACSFLLLFIFPQLKAQVTSAIPSPPIHAPQAADLGKVVFSPVSLYSGQPNISVPVYNVKNRNLEIPISLNYDASGFVPNKAPSPVGLNWSMVTGVITRTVNMFPDEMTENLGNTSSGPGVISKGFFHRTASHTNAQVNALEGLRTGTYYNKDYELSPDLFNFNFCGRTGTFMMGQDGIFYFQGEGVYKIELSNMDFPLDGFPFNNNYFGKITLTDESGIKYEFGGSISAVDFTSSSNTPNPSKSIPTAWYLVKVISPEGHNIEIDYKPLSNTNSDYTVVSYNASASPTVKNVYLSTIRSKSNSGDVLQTIQFTHSLRPVNQSFSSVYRNEQLDKIEVKDLGSNIVKEFQFGYTYYSFGTTTARSLLTSFTETGKPPHTFAYSNTTQLSTAYPAQKLEDYWGFYNNQPKPTNNNFTYDGDIQLIETPYQWDPSLAYTKTGILESITDPLKGISEFTFELHQYSKYEKLQGIGGYGLESQSGTAGGLRIAKIELKQGSQVLESRQYKYVKSYTPNGINFTSSGILYKKPLLYKFSGLTDLPDLNAVGEPHMSYAEVAEVFGDGSYKIHKFNSIEQYIDRTFTDGVSPRPYFIEASSLGGFTEYAVVNFFNQRSSTAMERGKPIEISDYNTSGNKVSMTEFVYNIDPNRYSKKITSLNFPRYGDPTHNIGVSISSFMATYENYFFPTRLTEKKVTEYGN